MFFFDLLGWIAVSLCIGFLLLIRKARPLPWGWVGVCLGIPIITGVLALLRPGVAGVTGMTLWALFVAAPLAIRGRIVQIAEKRQEYARAARWCRILALLHPFDGVRHHAIRYEILDAEYRGNTDDANRGIDDLVRVGAMTEYHAALDRCRLRGEWEAYIRVFREHGTASQPEFIMHYLRALGETGDLNTMAAGFQQYHEQISKSGAYIIDLCALWLFTFSGYTRGVEMVLVKPLMMSRIPEEARKFWWATADLVVGNPTARARLQEMESTNNQIFRKTIQRRLSVPLAEPNTLTAENLAIIKGLAEELDTISLA